MASGLKPDHSGLTLCESWAGRSTIWARRPVRGSVISPDCCSRSDFQERPLDREVGQPVDKYARMDSVYNILIGATISLS